MGCKDKGWNVDEFEIKCNMFLDEKFFFYYVVFINKCIDDFKRRYYDFMLCLFIWDFSLEFLIVGIVKSFVEL